MHYALGGQMVYHPYPYDIPRIPGRRTNELIARYAGGRWIDTPATTIRQAFKGGNLATTIAQGNYMTRNFRQKPIVGLQTATHTRKVSPKVSPKVSLEKSIEIPTVSSRRTKVYSKNKISAKRKAMPYKRYPRRPKRPFRGRRRKYNRRKRRIPMGIPPSKIVKFKVVHSAGGFGSGSGALNQFTVKANDLNDPMSSLGAELPLYLDQWAAMYSKYIVLGSKITWKPYLVSSTGAVVTGVHLADNTTSLADHDYYKEAKLNKCRILSSERPQNTITMTYSAKKFWKLSNVKDDSEQEATFSTTPGSPTDIAYFHIYNQDLQKSETNAVEGTITLEFIVLLTNPITPTRSSL